MASGGGNGVVRRGHRMLAAGHAKVEVVEHQHGDIDIAAGGVDKMRAADSCTAIADENNDVELRIRQFDACGVGDAASVQAMKSVGDEILIAEAHTTNIADNNGLGGIKLKAGKGFIQMIKDQGVTTAWTKGKGTFVFIGLFHFEGCDCHFKAPLNQWLLAISH